MLLKIMGKYVKLSKRYFGSNLVNVNIVKHIPTTPYIGIPRIYGIQWIC